MVLTKEQLSELIYKHSEREIGEYDAFGATGISPGKLRIRE